EHVTTHVADTDDRHRIALHVHTQLTEVALHGHPGTPGSDRHALVVIADRAAGGEGITHPEAVVLSDTVGDIGEAGGALVRCHHQVVVVSVVTDHLWRWY